MGMNDAHWMAYAYQLARTALVHGEVPVGAVLVNSLNQKIGLGWNRVIHDNDPSAHAEIIALRHAAHFTNNYRLENTTMYVTLEPCCMCAGALVHARIKRLVFATRDIKAGAAGSVYQLLHSKSLNHQIQIDEGCMQQECADLISDFFKSRRI